MGTSPRPKTVVAYCVVSSAIIFYILCLYSTHTNAKNGPL